MVPHMQIGARSNTRLLTVLYFVPIVALPIVVAGFGVLVLTSKPAHVPPTREAATQKQPAAAAISGASSVLRPGFKATGSSDPNSGQLAGSTDYLHVGNGVALLPSSEPAAIQDRVTVR
jgi:hypothetical protein